VKYTCVCGAQYESIIPPTGHDFEKTVISPTVKDMGYTSFSCECGFSYNGNYRFYSEIVDDAYAANNQVIARGIDISKWNHTVDSNGDYEPIDWAALKNAGVDYVILKIGSTISGLESTFEMDYAGAKAAGIDVGVYFFTYSTSVSQIKQDAETLLSWLDGKQFEYPIYLDIEDTEDGSYKPSEIAAPILTEMCLEFFSILQAEGYYTGLYINKSFLMDFMQTENMIDLFDIWYARYPYAAEYDDFTVDNSTSWNDEWVLDDNGDARRFGMWQYSCTGVLEPFPKSVDFNYCYKDYPTIIKNLKMNNYDLN
jgi:GH25 family lysozyme M1 (1,4-beta-N-acetylmuramidase)